MSREIKFRAWDNVNKNMEFDIHHLDCLNEYLSKEKYDVMQFTGLKDKNGGDIYEGDILHGREEGNGETTAWEDVYYLVFFKDGCFKVRTKNIDENSCWTDNLNDNEIIEEYEVIGNIYKNPELLKP